ncbi:MAG UNVERIFIED_CONTAM: hypothetical protein LVR18_44410 [Planctomycetaceae bacterium]
MKTATERTAPPPAAGTVPADLAATAAGVRLNDCQNRQNRKFREDRYKKPGPRHHPAAGTVPAPLAAAAAAAATTTGVRLNVCQNRQNRKFCEDRYKTPGVHTTPRRGLSPPLWRRRQRRVCG